jgi:TniQ
MSPTRTSSRRQPRKWPLHPHPEPLESMVSWLGRLASLYGLSVKDLITHNLDLLDVPWDMDFDPPTTLLAALAARTGIAVDRLRALSLAGWQPLLYDTVHVRRWDEQELFDTYVRANSVLLAPGEAGAHYVDRFKSWAGPWLPIPLGWLRRACPVCVATPGRGASLMWKLPLMVGCAEHGCHLENTVAIEVSLGIDKRPPTPRPVPEVVSVLDRYTYTALTTGRVELPGRSVHAAVWFRLLRSLLDEVSLSGTTVSKPGRATLELVWQATGRRERAGLNVWKPYEQLNWDTQEAMLHAAATALDLADKGLIRARGVFGSALAPKPRHPVYDGDPPPVDLQALAEEVLNEARADRAQAHQLLRILTYGSSTLARFEEHRVFLHQQGVPPQFLPSATELGRTDLL